jgi:AcrR family transcriptional regulator
VSTKERLLKVATNLLAEKGYHGMTTAEIVQAAGVKKPTLYYHFQDKISLLNSILQENWEPFLQIWDVPYSGDLPKEIRAKNRSILAWAEKRPQFLQAALALHWTPAGSGEGDSVSPYREAVETKITSWFRQATPDHGAFTGRETLLAKSYWGLLQVLFEQVILHSPPSDVELERLTHQFLHGIFS